MNGCAILAIPEKNVLTERISTTDKQKTKEQKEVSIIKKCPMCHKQMQYNLVHGWICLSCRKKGLF